MAKIGTAERPLRVAIIGAGPSGFYAAQTLLKQKEVDVDVDFFDHLPAPYGLVRYGVAPDHQKIKSVTRLYERIASDTRVRFFGNVTFGEDVTHADIREHYDQVIYAVGTQSDRHLDIPGEDLIGSFPATEFVAWYNGHPDYRDYEFDLSMKSVAVIGVGNVAMDVARILALSPAELEQTDIADYALEALRESQVQDIYIVARRGPAQVKFTNPELRELAELEVTDVIIDAAELLLDERSAAAVADNREAQTNLEIMQHYADLDPTGHPKRIHFLFLRSPVEVLGNDAGEVVGVRLEKNVLRPTETGYLNSHGTGEFEALEIGIIARSIGYRGEPLPGVPFHERWGIISNSNGRVSEYESGEIVPQEYVVGWAKRGPSGIIGTNKPDAVATVRLLLEDIPALQAVDDAHADSYAIVELLKKRDVRYVSWDEWLLINQAEVQAGQRLGRPRVKFTSVPDMIRAVDAAIIAQTKDVLIIGGGPAGLYSAFYAGLRGLKARVLEALPEVGGQLSTLYPDMDIYDVPGFVKIGAQDLATSLKHQAERFGDDVDICLRCQAESIEREDGVFIVHDSQGNTHRTRSLIIATGIGAIKPITIDIPSVRRLRDKGVNYFPHDKSVFRGKKVLVVGGGDSAVLWALNLKDWAAEVTLIHRSDTFRAAKANVAELLHDSVRVLTFHELKDVKGKQQVEQAIIVDTQSGDETTLAVDAVILNFGFRTDKSFIEGLSLEIDNKHVLVDGFGRTNQPGIYAVGDATQPVSGANLKLITTAVSQAAVAVNHVCHELYPEKSLIPPHSSTMRL